MPCIIYFWAATWKRTMSFCFKHKVITISKFNLVYNGLIAVNN